MKPRNNKTESELIKEIESLRKLVGKLEKSEAELNQAREALRESEGRLRNIIEHSTNAFYSHTPDHVLTYMSPQVTEILGYEPNEVMVRWTELASDNPINEKGFELTVKAIETAKPQPPYELEFIHKSGKKVWVEVHEGPVVVDGKTISIVGALTDITERVHAAKAIAESEERFRQVAESAEEWIWEVDADAVYTYASPVVEKLLGYKPEELVGKKRSYDLFNPDNHEPLRKATLKIFAEKKPLFRFLNRNVHKDGRIVWLLTSGLPILDENGELLGYRGADIDITERKQAEDELRKSREHLEERVRERTKELEENTKKLEESQRALTYLLEDVNESRAELDASNRKLQFANEELEAFSYSVSHDLRTPLRSIDGFSQMLLEGYRDAVDERGQHYLRRVRAGTQSMGRLIDDVLNLSRIGRQAMRRREIDMGAVAEEAYKSLEDEWKGRGVSFTVREIPTILADPDLMEIVLVNLLSNALKFTRKRESAEIEVGCETRDDQTVFLVRDNGVGFDMKYVGKLFAPFQRLHRAEDYEGTGVGLTIVQRIIHRHGGRIWVESKLDSGTTFYFTLAKGGKR